jgi:hypothetical protein
MVSSRKTLRGVSSRNTLREVSSRKTLRGVISREALRALVASGSGVAASCIIEATATCTVEGAGYVEGATIATSYVEGAGYVEGAASAAGPVEGAARLNLEACCNWVSNTHELVLPRRSVCGSYSLELWASELWAYFLDILLDSKT